MRFVVLLHGTSSGYPRGDHWDFMLEAGGMLRTWAIETEPVPGQIIPAEALSDHRLEYLTYEGLISGGRGQVTRWDTGTYQTLEESAGIWRGALSGGKLQGEVSLEQIQAQRWKFSWRQPAVNG
jgi:DNA polymerase Ligase (LigD)